MKERKIIMYCKLVYKIELRKGKFDYLGVFLCPKIWELNGYDA